MGIYRRGREGRGHRVNVPLHHPITHAWGQTQNEAPSAQSRHTHPDKVIEFPVYFPGITKTSVRYRVMFLLHCPVTHSQSKFGVWSSLYTAPSLSLGTGGIFAPSSPPTPHPPLTPGLLSVLSHHLFVGGLVRGQGSEAVGADAGDAGAVCHQSADTMHRHTRPVEIHLHHLGLTQVPQT